MEFEGLIDTKVEISADFPIKECKHEIFTDPCIKKHLKRTRRCVNIKASLMNGLNCVMYFSLAMEWLEIVWVDLHIKECIDVAMYPLVIKQWDIVQLGAEMTSMIKCIRKQRLNETSNYFFLFMIIVLRSSFMVYGRKQLIKAITGLRPWESGHWYHEPLGAFTIGPPYIQDWNEGVEAAIGISTTKKMAVNPKLFDWYMFDFAKDLDMLLDWVCIQLPHEIGKEAMSCLERNKNVPTSQ
ncbi:hypothetical protein CTI12_AA397730 [Artemisia annua]|uniref:Uncharacterized protein n=1 Tax=Artemisia annua TaxID=35608 RepID=A0A2U1M771_ARTAN|nr:hypothetical protein CTI12_AA397730 [Artemisia annua]